MTKKNYKEEAEAIVSFLQYSEGLKTENRSLNLSTGIPENVAAHSWRMGLMVMLVAPHLSKKANMEKMLKIALIHDLVEVEAGDVSVLDHFHNECIASQKITDEEAAMANIRSMLIGNNEMVGMEIEELWRDYGEQGSYEARVVKAIDKLEARLQLVLDVNRTFGANELSIMNTLQEKVALLCNVDPILIELEKITRINIS